MSVLNRTPQNTNLLQPTKYLLTFSRIPAAQYFLQSVNIPGVNAGQTLINTPVHDYYAASNKMEFSNLSINFLLDEELKSWQNIFNWMLAIADPKSIDERTRLQELQTGTTGKYAIYSDAVLTILSNLNNPIARVQFHGLFPTSLSDIQFDTKMSADDIMTADASFTYSYFEFVPLNS